MKKLILFLIIMVFSYWSLAANARKTAEPQWEGFTDWFTVQAPKRVKILHVNSHNRNKLSAFYVVKTDDTHFYFQGRKNGWNADNGRTKIVIGYNDNDNCVLKIQDGASFSSMNPNISSIKCSPEGTLQYAGLGHESGTYQYILKFGGRG